MAITMQMEEAGTGSAAAALHRNFRLSTPCFASGAAPDIPEIRLPSILGMVRMWWRATQFSYFGEGGGGLHQLRAREFELFGASASEGIGGQGQFVSTLTGPSPRTEVTPKLPESVIRLAGRGVRNRPRHLAPMPNDNPFKLSFRFKRSADIAAREDLERAVDLWLGLGGLGLCSRRGFGGCDRLTDQTPMEKADFLGQILRHLPAVRPNVGPALFPLISTHAHIWAHFMDAGTSGQFALERHASDLNVFARAMPAPLPIDEVFSDQVPRSGRSPSPVHTHVAVLADATIVMNTYLPTCWRSTALDTRIRNFFARPEFQSVWPPDKTTK